MRCRHVLMIIILLSCLGVAGCHGNSNAQDEDRPAPVAQGARDRDVVLVEVREVVPEPLHDVLLLPGSTEARHDVRISSERAGRVEWVGFTEGDKVLRGEIIAKIDLSALKAALDRAQASYDLKKLLAERRQALYDRKVLSLEELDQALTEMVKAQSDLRTTQVEHEQGIVRSPIDGTVERMHVDPGEYVSQGDPVADLVCIDTIRVNVNVPEMDIRYIQSDQKVGLRVDAYPEAQWVGHVDFVARKADAATKTFQVRVVVDNADGRIRPGMIARVVFLRRMIQDAVTAPLYVIQDKGGERVIFVEKDGVAHSRTIEPGVIEGDRIQILSGLRAGERLIVKGFAQVEDGTRVQVQ